MDGELLGIEAKVLGVVQGLINGRKLWKMITSEYPSSYVDFRYRADVLINNAEMLAQRLGEKDLVR